MQIKAVLPLLINDFGAPILGGEKKTRRKHP